ncbi:MAG: Activator of Hsp90 ATPase 1 family protein [Ilumatobacteraceae bacterium]|nr:Activator of Hsp90 ATPase 1 family protein [Ilumatobacteraceae bacterium]
MNITDLAVLIGRTKRSVVDNGDRRSIVMVRSYDWPISDVWDAWTDPDRLARWLGELRGTPLGRRAGIGDTVQLWVGPREPDTATLTILACDAPERLTVRWQWPGETDSFVDLTLRAVDEHHSEVRLEHTALTGDRAAEYGAGWEELLARAAAVLDIRDESDAGFEGFLEEVTPLWTEAAASAATDPRWPILIDAEDGSAVVVGRTFTQPIGVVWELLTSPASMVEWFGDFAGSAELRGAFSITFDGGSATGTVRECAAPDRLVVSWSWAHQDFETLLSVHLRETEAGTVVTLRQDGVIGPALGYSAGWSAYLAAAERQLSGRLRSEAAWQADWEIAFQMISRGPAR